jgi:multiple sugar transport system permease protein
MKKESIRSLKKREITLAYICLLPVLTGIVFFVIIPVIAGLILSFTDYSVLSDARFIGLQNYIDIFTTDKYFFKSIGVTFYNAIGSVIVGTVAALFLAMLLNARIPLRGFWRSVYYLPCVMPAMAVSILWGWMFNVDFGLFNLILRSLGLPRSLWLAGEITVMPSLWIMGLWCSGGGIIIFLAGLQNVPKVFYEAAEIDGASRVSRFVHITIPMMSPVIFYNFLLSMIGAMQAFTQAYVLTGGGPNNATLFTVFLIYREGFRQNRFGYANAVSFLFFIIVGLMTALIFKTSNKWIFYEGK